MSLTLNDLWYRWLSANLSSANQADNGVVTPGGGISGTTTESVFANGSQAAPAAFTIICATGLVTGLYRVRAQAGYMAGVPTDPAETANFRLSASGISKWRILPSLVVGNVVTTEGFIRLNNEAIRISSVAAATAGVVYAANIVAEKWAD